MASRSAGFDIPKNVRQSRTKIPCWASRETTFSVTHLGGNSTITKIADDGMTRNPPTVRRLNFPSQEIIQPQCQTIHDHAGIAPTVRRKPFS